MIPSKIIVNFHGINKLICYTSNLHQELDLVSIIKLDIITQMITLDRLISKLYKPFIPYILNMLTPHYGFLEKVTPVNTINLNYNDILNF